MAGYWVRPLAVWFRLQHHFGLTAFGASLYRTEAAGIQLGGSHDETASGQEELFEGVPRPRR